MEKSKILKNFEKIIKKFYKKNLKKMEKIKNIKKKKYLNK
jgi:hypothetical protein